MSVLLLRLAGPMQAWGTQSRFSVRDTGLEPSKSGVIGLLCAALGKSRRESSGDGHPALADLAALRMGVRVDRPGTMQADYHTAMDVLIASSEPGRKPKLKACEPSTRYYLADADFLVGLEGPHELLSRLQQALTAPVWPLFLGRKAFPPAMPVHLPDGLLADAGLVDALKSAPWWKRSPWERLPDPLRARILVEQEPGVLDGEVRNDVPLDFHRPSRSFSPRRVRDVELWDIPDALIRSWPPCTSPDSN